jgi:hypothetical protein
LATKQLQIHARAICLEWSNLPLKWAPRVSVFRTTFTVFFLRHRYVGLLRSSSSLSSEHRHEAGVALSRGEAGHAARWLSRGGARHAPRRLPRRGAGHAVGGSCTSHEATAHGDRWSSRLTGPIGSLVCGSRGQWSTRLVADAGPGGGQACPADLAQVPTDEGRGAAGARSRRGRGEAQPSRAGEHAGQDAAGGRGSCRRD